MELIKVVWQHHRICIKLYLLCRVKLLFVFKILNFIIFHYLSFKSFYIIFQYNLFITNTLLKF